MQRDDSAAARRPSRRVARALTDRVDRLLPVPGRDRDEAGKRSVQLFVVGVHQERPPAQGCELAGCRDDDHVLDADCPDDPPADLLVPASEQEPLAADRRDDDPGTWVVADDAEEIPRPDVVWAGPP